MSGGWAPGTCLCALVFAQLPAWAEPAAPAASLPAASLPAASLLAEATAFVTRRTGCDHWMGEDAYDPARGRDIAAAVKALRCDAVEADEKRLRRLYGRDPAVLRILDRDADR